MEYLATVEVSGHGSLRAVLEALRRSPQSGSLVVVLGRATRAELDILRGSAARSARWWSS